MILVKHRLNHYRLHLINKKGCLHIWTFGINQRNYLDFFCKCSEWPSYNLAHKLQFWSGRCQLYSDMGEMGGDRGFNASPSFFDQSGCNFQETFSMTRPWSSENFIKLGALWSDRKYEIANLHVFISRIFFADYKTSTNKLFSIFFKSKIFFLWLR